MSISATEAPFTATHQLEWVPPYLKECGPPAGFWRLIDLENGWTPPGWAVLDAPRNAPQEKLGEWVTAQLLRPVAMQASVHLVHRTVLRIPVPGPGRREPVYYITAC